MQSQDMAPAKWAIGQRAVGVSESEVDDALSQGRILRTHLLRPTWHFVAARDIRWLLELTGPRVRRQTEGRSTELGLDHGTLANAVATITSALHGGTHLTREQLGILLREEGLDPGGQRLPYILMHCELDGAICSGNLAGKRQTYALLDERAPDAARFDTSEALVSLVGGYLRSHGPATLNDMKWWSGLKISDLRSGLEALSEEVARVTWNGLELWSLVEDGESSQAEDRAHLLQAYDEMIVGYSESRFAGDPIAETARSAWRNREIPGGVLLLAGRVFGYWRRRAQPKRIRVELLTYDTPNDSESRLIEREIHRMERFFDSKVEMQIARV